MITEGHLVRHYQADEVGEVRPSSTSRRTTSCICLPEAASSGSTSR